MPQHSVQQQRSGLPDVAPQDVQRYFPLRLGYIWTYAETVMTPTQQLVLQRRVTLTMQRRDRDEYIAHWDFQSGATKLPNMRYRRVHDGIQYAQLTGDTTYTGFSYLLKTPLTVDTTWKTIQGFSVRITAIHHACTTPAGTFPTCLETRQDAEPTPTTRIQTTQRFAQDIGLVWQQRHLIQQNLVQRIDTMALQKLPEAWQL